MYFCKCNFLFPSCCSSLKYMFVHVLAHSTCDRT